MSPDLAEAEARAARNGLTLETFEEQGGVAWPAVRWVGARLMRGRDVVASAAQSYRDDVSKARALSSCLIRVYNRP